VEVKLDTVPSAKVYQLDQSSLTILTETTAGPPH
jgi:hypothetical protein